MPWSPDRSIFVSINGWLSLGDNALLAVCLSASENKCVFLSVLHSMILSDSVHLSPKHVSVLSAIAYRSDTSGFLGLNTCVRRSCARQP